MKMKHWVVVVAVVLLAVSAVGCRQPAPEPTPRAEPPSTAEPTQTTEPTTEVLVRLYFVRDEKLGAAGRTITDPGSIELLAKAAVTELLNGVEADDEKAGLGTAIPQGARVDGVTVAGDTATADLSKEFESGGGSLSMQLRVAQIVYTLTQFEQIKSVAFEIDGEPVKAIGGEGLIVDPPVDRTDFEALTPAILVEDPLPNQTVTSPLKATGTSNTFEATHQLQLLDASGKVLSESFVTATSGTGTRGTWERDLEFFIETGGPGTLRAFVLSAKDGSEEDVVEIPVVLGK